MFLLLFFFFFFSPPRPSPPRTAGEGCVAVALPGEGEVAGEGGGKGEGKPSPSAPHGCSPWARLDGKENWSQNWVLPAKAISMQGPRGGRSGVGPHLEKGSRREGWQRDRAPNTPLAIRAALRAPCEAGDALGDVCREFGCSQASVITLTSTTLCQKGSFPAWIPYQDIPELWEGGMHTWAALELGCSFAFGSSGARFNAFF